MRLVRHASLSQHSRSGVKRTGLGQFQLRQCEEMLTVATTWDGTKPSTVPCVQMSLSDRSVADGVPRDDAAKVSHARLLMCPLVAWTRHSLPNPYEAVNEWMPGATARRKAQRSKRGTRPERTVVSNGSAWEESRWWLAEAKAEWQSQRKRTAKETETTGQEGLAGDEKG